MTARISSTLRATEEQSPNGEVSREVLNEARTVVTEVDGKRIEVTVLAPEHQGRTRLRERRAQLAERSARSGNFPVTSTPEEFAAFIAKEAERWGKALKDIGLKYD